MKDGLYIIDSHCHIYPDKIAEKATQSTSDFYSTPSHNNGKLSILLQKAADAGIDRIIVQSVATAPSQVGSINRYIAGEVSANSDKLVGLGTLHPDSQTLDEDIALIRQLGLKGVKLHADIQKIAIDDPRCYKIYERLQGVMPVLLHCGDHRYNYSNPDNLEPVLKDFPRLAVVGAHFGGWSVWHEAARRLSGYENLYVDTSSTLGFTSASFVGEMIKLYDENKILFGVDYPMWSPADEVNMIFSLGLGREKLQKIVSGNTARLYGIDII